MMNQEMINRINQIVEDMDLTWDYAYVGVRVQEPEFQLGEIDHLSHVWVDGDETDEELDGICVCKIDRLGRENYFGDHVAIICGNEATYGEDDGELIISDPVVAAIIC